MSRRIFLQFLLICAVALPLAACKEDTFRGMTAPGAHPKMVMDDSNIVFWTMLAADNVGVKLNEEGTAALDKLTRENTNKPIDLYVGDYKVASPIVQEPISNGQLQLYAGKDKAKLDRILATLPQSKKR